jgi:hypothetical protein
MNSKSISIALVAIAALSVSFAIFQYSKSDNLVKENIEWKTKYEEALIDMVDANKRIETMKVDLEKTLKESEAHRIKAEAALLELEQHKGKKR